MPGSCSSRDLAMQLFSFTAQGELRGATPPTLALASDSVRATRQEHPTIKQVVVIPILREKPRSVKKVKDDLIYRNFAIGILTSASREAYCALFLIGMRLPNMDAARFAGRINAEEITHMSEPTPLVSGIPGPLRTLAVRLTDELRAQLDIIAQLNDRTVTEEIRIALEDWIGRARSDPKVFGRAEIVRAEIEREAQIKRDAISAIFPTTSAAAAASSKAKSAMSKE